MTTLFLSAIICTHNRDRYLGAAIDSLLEQSYGNFEVIVVDNASTDQTRAVVEARLNSLQPHHPHLRYVEESTLGLSVARNRGWQESQGEILVYLDDDAVASPDWLKSLAAAYDANDRLAIAGGRVTLLWPEEQPQAPRWLSTDQMSGLGLYDLGPEQRLIQEPGLTPRGLNYSMRRSFLEILGGFDAQLGRVGKKLLSNEELYVTEKALSLGYDVAYLPEALVAHNVAPERLAPSWFLRRSWWQGISEYYRDDLGNRPNRDRLLATGERFVRGLYKSVKYVGNPALCLDNLTYAYGQIGYLSVFLQNCFQREIPHQESVSPTLIPDQ